MPRLVLPLKTALHDGFDEADVQRVWRGLLARSTRRSTGSSGVRWVLPRAALAMAGFVMVLALWRWLPWAQGPLALAGGERPPAQWVVPASERQRWVDFADGSRIGLDPGAQLDVLGNSDSEFLIALRQGNGTFEVHPGGPRRWVVECGVATVEVVGTKFSIERSSGRVQVAVSSGVVLVRGERVPDRVQRFRAGEKIEIPAVEPGPAPSDVAAPVEVKAPAMPSAEEPALDPSACAPSSASAPASPSRHPAAAASGAGSELDDLVKRADSARRSGDLAEATALLERAVRLGGKDPRTAIAALTLARLTMNGSPERAARVLSTALAAGAPRGLEEDAMARLVEARARSGDREGARRAAAEYQRRYPAGARLAEVRRWSPE